MKPGKDWVHYLSRPFGIFGASLWVVWYDSPSTKELFGVTMPDCLCIEEHPGVVRRYAIREQLERFTGAVRQVVARQPERCRKILEAGVELNRQAERLLKQDRTIELQAAVDFMVRLTLHATIFPYFGYEALHGRSTDADGLLKLAEGLRAVSFYPRIISDVVLRSAKARAGDAADVLLLSEVLAGDTSNAAARGGMQRQSKRFVYQRLDGKETVEWVDDALAFIWQLEGFDAAQEVRGSCACTGKVRGVVRLVHMANPEMPFSKGDIVIAATLSPTLLPLLSRCGAIVTDEGGMTSHAAILSRELNKPCVIGTKHATHVFRDGDLVEVDAEKGVVKKLLHLNSG